ncbi:MAG: hypothetical protein WC054_00010 [Candidatus Nanopelagicales bacterium]
MTNTEISRYDFESALELVAYTDIREDYSGRGMFGSRCVGIVIEGPYYDVKTSLLGHAETIREEVEALDGDEESDAQFEQDQLELASIFEGMASRMSVDNMGLDTIVYWPYLGFKD